MFNLVFHPRIDKPEKKLWLERYQALVGTVVGICTVSLTLWVTAQLERERETHEHQDSIIVLQQNFDHQAAVAADEKRQSAVRLRAILLSELLFEQDQLNTAIKAAEAAEAHGTLMGFILLPAGDVFRSRLSDLGLLVPAEAQKVYAAESYYNLARDQLEQASLVKHGGVIIVAAQSVAGLNKGFLATQTIVDEAVRLLSTPPQSGEYGCTAR